MITSLLTSGKVISKPEKQDIDEHWPNYRYRTEGIRTYIIQLLYTWTTNILSPENYPLYGSLLGLIRYLTIQSTYITNKEMWLDDITI